MNLKGILLPVILLFQLSQAAKSQTVNYITGEKIQADDSSYFQIYAYDMLYRFILPYERTIMNFMASGKLVMQVFSRKFL